MKSAICGMLAAALVLAFVSPARSASLLRFELVPDGSSDPPGDRIEVSLILFPGEDSITLETRAFVRDEVAGSDVAPVAASDHAHRDDRGRWLSRTKVDRRQGQREARLRIIVPYASLKLTPGRYELAYEVKGVRGADVDFARATPMTPLVVSTHTRVKTVERDEVGVTRPKREKRTAYAVKGGKLVAQDVEIETDVTEIHHERRTVKVEIPGEFSRPVALKTRGAPAPRGDENAIQASVVPLEGKAWTSLAEFTPRQKRVVHYATNRAVASPAVRDPSRFGNDMGPAMVYGSCLVNIPVEHHTRGEMEVPVHWWQSRDPRRYFLVEALDTLTLDQFRKTLSSDDLLLFIHGYNSTFEAAVLRTAQLVHDLRFPGKGVTLSWPSEGSLSGYAHDEAENARSVDAVTALLKELTRPVGPSGKTRRVHVIVHSMGNRLFLQAARQLELELGSGDRSRTPGPIFGHVALAAPDVDATSFSALVPSVIRQSASTTLYYCQSDRALLASRTLHMDKPVGLGPFFAEGLDTINADRANTSFLGHGYFASAHPLLIDLQLTIDYNQKPPSRLPPLGRHTRILGYDHWSLLDVAAMSEAAGG